MPRGKRGNYPHLPPNPTIEEYEIIEYSITNIYTKIDDPIDKFLVAFVFELGYTQSLASQCLEIDNAAVTRRIQKIKRNLGMNYTSRVKE